MEQCNNDTRKRARDDSVEDSSDSKRVSRRVDSDSNANSSGVNDIQDDLYNIFDAMDNNLTDRETTSTVHGLDSFIEEQIVAPDQDPNLAPELNPNLGYLLEASDDELGLPPPKEEPEPEPEKLEIDDNSCRVDGPEGVDMSGFFWFEEEIRNYEGFGFVDENGGGYVTIDGLFDHAETMWRSESLQAI